MTESTTPAESTEVSGYGYLSKSETADAIAAHEQAEADNSKGSE